MNTRFSTPILPTTPVVRVLIWINAFTFFFIKLTQNKTFLSVHTYETWITLFLGVLPVAVKQDLALWQPITYMFVHTTFFHFLFNMLGLWWFGADVESEMGSKKFLRYYFFCGIGAGLISVLFNTPTIGASGAIYGLLLAYGLAHPNRILYLYFVFPLKAKYCVLLFGVLELFFLVSAGADSGINHLAHLGGLLFGGLWMFFGRYPFEPKLWWKVYQKQRARRKLKIVRVSDTPGDETAQTPTIH